MGYDMRKKGLDPEKLTEEETDIQTALTKAGYQTIDTAPDEVDPDDFIPTFKLYKVYRDYVSRFWNPLEDVEILGYRKFGAALGRVYPHLEDREPDAKGRLRRVNKARRWYHGTLCWGYLGIRGPDSVRTPGERGRPTRARRETLNAESDH